MADLVSQLFDRLKAIGPEVGVELSRMGTQGEMELASALFSNANAFVPYGPGQYTPSPNHQQEVEQQHEVGIER